MTDQQTTALAELGADVAAGRMTEAEAIRLVTQATDTATRARSQSRSLLSAPDTAREKRERRALLQQQAQTQGAAEFYEANPEPGRRTTAQPQTLEERKAFLEAVRSQEYRAHRAQDHSPAPWKAEKRLTSEITIRSACGAVIGGARCDSYLPAYEAEANGRMFEQAPLLLETLRQCKAAAENPAHTPSARLELIRDLAQPAIVLATTTDGRTNPAETWRQMVNTNARPGDVANLILDRDGLLAALKSAEQALRAGYTNQFTEAQCEAMCPALKQARAALQYGGRPL